MPSKAVKKLVVVYSRGGSNILPVFEIKMANIFATYLYQVGVGRIGK